MNPDLMRREIAACQREIKMALVMLAKPRADKARASEWLRIAYARTVCVSAELMGAEEVNPCDAT